MHDLPDETPFWDAALVALDELQARLERLPAQAARLQDEMESLTTCLDALLAHVREGTSCDDDPAGTQ